MALNEDFFNTLPVSGNPITHIALVDDTNTQIGARQAVTWNLSDQIQRPSDHLVFEIPPGTTVSGWQGYSASSGGTAYGVIEMADDVFNNGGTFTLRSNLTGIEYAAG